MMLVGGKQTEMQRLVLAAVEDNSMLLGFDTELIK
jgi:hypothetical protein